MDHRSDAASDPSGCPPDPETESGGGITVLDLVLVASGSWALPCAVEAAAGRRSWYFVGALIAGGVGGLFWGWYCVRFERFLHERLRGAGGGPERRDIGFWRLQIVYVVVLVLSILLQYALYRVLGFVLQTGG